MKRALCLILAALMAAACVSCSEKTAEEAPADDNAAAAAENADVTGTVEPDEPEGIPEPELPEKDYAGAAFTTLTRGRYSGSFEEPFLIAEELNGEPVNDAIYNRNMEIEDKFNLDVLFIENPDAAGEVQRLAAAADTSVDVVNTQGTSLASLSTKGYLMNLLKIDDLNLSAEYWSENVMNDLQIDGHLYMMTSDLSMTRLEYANFLYFNKVLIGDYNLEDPYTLVEEGRWTLDKYLDDIAVSSSDLNGDGQFDSHDLYGAIYEPSDILFYLVGCGVKFTERDEAKGLNCIVYSEKTIDVLNRFKECFDSRNTTQYLEISAGVDTSGYDNAWEWARTLFAQRQFLFLPCGMFELMNLRDMEDDFGLAPLPKYDEAQEDYSHKIHQGACIFSIPASCSDAERAGVVLEYGSWISNKLLLPAYYDTTVKQKRIRDEKAPVMVDIVRRTARYEISDVYDLGISSMLSNALSNGDFASLYAKNEKVIAKSIQRLFDTVKDLD